MKSDLYNAICWLTIQTFSLICQQTYCLADDLAKDTPSPTSKTRSEEVDSAQDTLGEVDQWSAKNATTQAQRELISLQNNLKLISTDLQSQPQADAPYLRYLTLANLYNIRGIDGNSMESDANMEGYRSAVSELLKSLSKSSSSAIVAAVDSTGTLLRFDLRQCGITREGWESIVGCYPYGIVDSSSDVERRIETLTGTRQACLRADWFVSAAIQYPLSDNILHIRDDLTQPVPPIQTLRDAYERDIFQEQASAELWIDQQTLFDLLSRCSDPALAFLETKIKNGLPCSRSSFIRPFKSAIRELGLEVVESGSQSMDLIDVPTSAVTSNSQPDRARISIPGGGTLTITMSKLFYRIGESLGFTVSSDTDCYIKIVQLGSDRSKTQLVPNGFNANNKVHAGEIRSFPGRTANRQKSLSFTTTPPPGPEILLTIVSRSQFRDDFKFPADESPFRQYDPSALIGARGAILIQAGSDASAPIEAAIAKGEVGYLLEPNR